MRTPGAGRQERRRGPGLALQPEHQGILGPRLILKGSQRTHSLGCPHGAPTVLPMSPTPQAENTHSRSKQSGCDQQESVRGTGNRRGEEIKQEAQADLSDAHWPGCGPSDTLLTSAFRWGRTRPFLLVAEQTRTTTRTSVHRDTQQWAHTAPTTPGPGDARKLPQPRRHDASCGGHTAWLHKCW